MRYWSFDVCALISDFKKNKRTLSAIESELESCRRMMENPIGDTSRGDWQKFYDVLVLREKEFLMYVNMVNVGLGDLPEVERLVLEFWLLDGMSDEYIIEHCAIESKSELKKIKQIALTKFTNLVMPN